MIIRIPTFVQKSNFISLLAKKPSKWLKMHFYGHKFYDPRELPVEKLDFCAKVGILMIIPTCKSVVDMWHNRQNVKTFPSSGLPRIW